MQMFQTFFHQKKIFFQKKFVLKQNNNRSILHREFRFQILFCSLYCFYVKQIIQISIIICPGDV